MRRKLPKCSKSLLTFSCPCWSLRIRWAARCHCPPPSCCRALGFCKYKIHGLNRTTRFPVHKKNQKKHFKVRLFSQKFKNLCKRLQIGKHINPLQCKHYFKTRNPIPNRLKYDFSLWLAVCGVKMFSSSRESSAAPSQPPLSVFHRKSECCARGRREFNSRADWNKDYPNFVWTWN